MLDFNPTAFKLGYLLYLYHENQRAFSGGSLVTNEHGEPLEFRHTSSLVRPDRWQQIIFGDSLTAFIAVEVIGLTLWKNLEVKPQVLFVRDSNLMGMARKRDDDSQVDVPIALMQVVPEMPQLLPPTRWDPVPFPLGNASSTEHGEIHVLSDNKDDISLVRRIVDEACKSMRLIEPFNRITTFLNAAVPQMTGR